VLGKKILDAYDRRPHLQPNNIYGLASAGRSSGAEAGGKPAHARGPDEGAPTMDYRNNPWLYRASA
jgi:hypothetical protein